FVTTGAFMNKIYSKVWNKSLGMLVVASEHARANGKGGASRRLRAIMAVTGMAMVLGAAPTMAAQFVAKPLGAAAPTAPVAGEGGTAGGDSSVADGYL